MKDVIEQVEEIINRLDPRIIEGLAPRVQVKLDNIFEYWRKKGFSPTMLINEDGTVGFVSKDYIEEEDDIIWSTYILVAACNRVIQEDYYHNTSLSSPNAVS